VRVAPASRQSKWAGPRVGAPGTAAEALLDRMLNKIDDLCDERDRGIVGSLVWLPPGLIGGMHAGRRKLRLAKCAGQAYEVCRPIFHSSGVNGLSGLEQATGTFAA